MANERAIVRLLNDPNEAVEIALDRESLPRDYNDVAAALQAELATLATWVDVAEAYARRGDERAFEGLMEMVCAPGTMTTTRTRLGKTGCDYKECEEMMTWNRSRAKSMMATEAE